MSLPKIAISALCIFIFITSAFAQSGVFFVPSTDTQEKETLHVTLEAYSHFAKYENGGLQSYGPSIVYGLKKNVEIGVNYYLTYDVDGGAHELQPNIKWKAYENENSGVAVSVGTVAFIPLNKKAGDRMTAQFYLNASKTFESVKDMRLTGGIYGLANTSRDFGSRTGLMVGFEQPITKKFKLIADWTSGKNSLGYSNFGFSYDLKRSQNLSVAYTIGNSGRGNNFLSIHYGFSIK
ncbi:MAG: hypothetical protein KA956_01430 [Pyrinomonadaceae bacterium]|nr:hypothetical protein [Acidobacteriota bacterium]MBK7931908.1 hypothetical protein [Acidobacteriota bacterium]MBP7375115.1 hypothetical protein [Pyrinomonadaceae bacterium]